MRLSEKKRFLWKKRRLLTVDYTADGMIFQQYNDVFQQYRT